MRSETHYTEVAPKCARCKKPVLRKQLITHDFMVRSLCSCCSGCVLTSVSLCLFCAVPYGVRGLLHVQRDNRPQRPDGESQPSIRSAHVDCCFRCIWTSRRVACIARRTNLRQPRSIARSRVVIDADSGCLDRRPSSNSRPRTSAKAAVNQEVRACVLCAPVACA